ncbi:MAG: SAP domain-containing protein [Thermoguttaceae bacterium]|nr:SAP domain-containing protein [Thermoguttaceae bacterium]
MMKLVKLRVLTNHPDSKKGLNDAGLTQRIVASVKRFSSPQHVINAVHAIEPDVDKRNLKWLILFHILLEEETYSLEEDKLDERIIVCEKDIVRRAGKLDFFDPKVHDDARIQAYTTYKIVLEAAWRNDDDISTDEAELLTVLRDRLNISMEEHWLISCDIGRFPKKGRRVHNRDEINDARFSLQRHALLWSYRDDSNRKIDVVPYEIAEVLRRHVAKPPLELQRINYTRILQHESVTLSDLQKALIEHGMDRYGKKDALIDRIAQSDVPPSEVLDALDRGKLSQMCGAVGLPISGNKPDLIARLIDFYDDLSFAERTSHDEREVWYANYEVLAARDYATLKAKKIISRDLDIEHMFEAATCYLFDKKLRVPIEAPKGKQRADGRILLDGKRSILWDCKSVEKLFHLQDCLESQFDGYIRREREHGYEPIAFMVIAPGFTPNSRKLAMQYKARTNWDIALVTAEALKYVADAWSTSESSRPFPAGLFNRTDVIDRDKAELLLSLA